MKYPKVDGVSTSVHLDLMSGHNEIRLRVFTALKCFELIPSEQERRAEVLESYDVTEEDIQKYYPDWLRMKGN